MRKSPEGTQEIPDEREEKPHGMMRVIHEGTEGTEKYPVSAIYPSTMMKYIYYSINMSNFSFGKISTKSRKQVLNLRTYDNPILMDRSKVRAEYDKVVAVLVEDRFGEKELGYIDTFLKALGVSKYIILDALNCDYDEKGAKEGLIKFYKANRSDFMKYIPEGSPILTSGPALYSLLQEDDIYPNHCHQIIFGKSNFWFSQDLTKKNCHRVYPLDPFKDDIFGFELYKKWNPGAVDSYKTKLAQIQINQMLRHINDPLPEYPKLNKIFIESKEDFIERFYEPNKNRKEDLFAWDLETSGLNFYKDKIGCITLSFDGITGYYIPWKILDYDCKVKLNQIMSNNKSITANGKFDIKFLWRPEPTKKVKEGYLIVEQDGIKYKIMNNEKVLTKNGIKTGKELNEEDTLLEVNNLRICQ